MQEPSIKIIEAIRNEKTFLPKELLREDEILIEGINYYCEINNLNPIFIDKSIAIFKDKYLIAVHSDEI